MGIITNPILPGFNPDPSITYVPNVGYIICTSSFEFWPALPIYHSTDLVSWKLVGHALSRRDQGIDLRNSENSSGLWAPTIRYHKGRVYVACTSINRERFAIFFVAVSFMA
jgi:xylan 1,4-beta-xylosidase